MGRPPKLLRRDESHQPLSVKELALCLSPIDLRRVSWREGTRGTMRSRFAALRVRVAHRDYARSQVREEQWLLIEWPTAEKEPTKYWLSNLRRRSACGNWCHGEAALAHRARLRGTKAGAWTGALRRTELARLHHHASLCIAAFAFWWWSAAFFPRARLATAPCNRPPPSPTPPSPWRETPRRCRFEPNGITRIPSPPCARDRNPPARSLPRCPCCYVNSYNTVV